jgi:predicted phosphoribosyltransferase
MRFANRAAAGRQLAQRLLASHGRQTGAVYALPRGGVILAAEVADLLDLPLDLIIARKISHPRNRECAVGAVTETGDPIVDRAAVADVPVEWFERQVAVERREARQRRQTYLGNRAPQQASGKLAIVVDDGIATGLTMIAALRELQTQRPKRLVVAAPIIPADTVLRLQQEADDVVALATPASHLDSVGAYYDSFDQVIDEEVVRLLNAHPPRGKSADT